MEITLVQAILRWRERAVRVIPFSNISRRILEMWSSEHVHWLIDTEEKLTTADGLTIRVLEFRYEDNDEILSKWARHFRNHYCLDSEIDLLREGTGYSRTEYLKNLKLPTDSKGLGPGTRSGDFGEILVADYLEFMAGYWIPRTRYDSKVIRNESTKGSDVVGFKFVGDVESPDDTLSIFEVKTQFSGATPLPKLQEAINDSIKDELRKGESLNAIKQRLLDKQRLEEAKKVARFQNFVDRPYKDIQGAAALFSANVYDPQTVTSVSVNGHPGKDNLTLLVIRGSDMMNLVHKLYERAANEA
jgi:hypothetical protein